MTRNVTLIATAACYLGLLTSCTYNPFLLNNHSTGNAGSAAIGASIGAGAVALLNGPKTLMVAAGLVGGAAGYYASTLRYAAGGVLQGDGKVYKIGDFLGIDLPSDKLFEPNSADFIPQAKPILDSAAAVLKRYPHRNILISGNTSGFYRPRWEQALSLRRAERVAAYLWNAGINNTNRNLQFGNLSYAGYGSYMPIAKDLRNEGIRENSHIQITSYPSRQELGAIDPPPFHPCNATDSLGKCLDEASSAPPPVPACSATDSLGKCLDEVV
jgi:outer membrane protein OmpA-like peptidoglycan-associated protein